MDSNLTKVTIVDFQLCGGKKISEEVDAEIHTFWNDNNFGNDYYYSKYGSVNEFDEMHGRAKSPDYMAYPAMAEYLKSLNIEGPILIHWWW